METVLNFDFTYLNQIVQQFSLTGRLYKATPIGTGLINHTFKLVVKKDANIQSYILQKINTAIFNRPDALMNNINRVAKHLLQKNYPKKVLQPIPTCDGQLFYYHKKEDTYWRLYPFFENTICLDIVKEETLAYEVAYTFGEYNRFLYDLAPTALEVTIPDFHHVPNRLKKLVEVIQTAGKIRMQSTKLVLEEIGRWQHLLKYYKPLQSFERIVHNDTKVNNVLLSRQSQKGICVIDLDTVMPGILANDFGDLVRTITPPVDENSRTLDQVVVRSTYLAAVTNGFFDGLQAAIQPEEKDLLFYGACLLIYEQAIRFLTDYLQEDQYYPIEYPMQNLVRTEHQLRLLRNFYDQI